MFTKPVALSLLVVCLSVFTQTDAVPFEPCGGTLGRIVAIDITGCPASGVCKLTHRERVVFSLRFTSSVPLKDSMADATVFISGLRVSLPGNGELACSNIEPACSDKVSDKEYTYSREVEILRGIPPGTYELNGKLLTSSGDQILCAKAPVEVL